MTIRLKFRHLLIPVLLMGLHLCRAQAPDGSFSFSFDNSTPIIDLSGDYSITLPVIQKDGNEVDVSLGVTMIQSASGTVTGDTNNNVTAVQIGNTDPVAGVYKIIGRVTTAQGSSRVALLISINGWLNDQVTPFSLSIATEGQIDLGAADIAGRSLVHGRLGPGKLVGVADGELAALPSNMDGTWTLTLTNVAPTRPLTGSALITLSNGRVFPLQLTGQYSASQAQSKLHLTGVGTSKGIRLNALLPDTEDEIFVSGAALGQKVGTPATPAQGTP